MEHQVKHMFLPFLALLACRTSLVDMQFWLRETNDLVKQPRVEEILTSRRIKEGVLGDEEANKSQQMTILVLNRTYP